MQNTRFSKLVYTLLALFALLAVTSCATLQDFYNGITGEEEEVVPAQTTTQQAPPQKPVATPAPVPAVPAQPTQNKEEYAPPTHMNAAPPAPQTGVYAPPTVTGAAAVSNVPIVKVALLIPMSGDSTELGKSLLDAAVMAIYDKYSSLSTHEITARVQLIPKDTGDSTEGAEKAAQDAIQEGASLILGPVFSKQVNVVAANARRKNIPVITFSNNMAVAGDGVYLFGFIPEQQVTRVVQYALTHNVTSVAALVPSNPYGAAIVKQLSNEARKNNSHLHPVEYYSEDMSALDNNVGRLARFLQDDPVKGQALFIAEGGEKLKLLTDALTANGINSSNVQLLGTGLWDDQEVIKWPALYGGWFASSPPEKYQAFEQRFLATYSYKPERRASLSYDAVALAVNLALSSKGQGFPKEMITDPVGFNGPANGIFRFREDGSIERGLSILMITNTGFKTIDPSPTMFNQ